MAVWYGGGKARAPMLDPDPRAHRDEWYNDLRQIKSLGFNSIRCWIDWASAEPREGVYHFETLQQLTDLARQVGLRVIVQVYIDSAPDWVGKKFPDSHFVSISGEVMPSHAAPGYCFDHPGVRAAVLRLFTALAKRMKDRPAFLGWDLWSEPHIVNWAEATYMRSAEFCFCPYTIARFRGWLQHKYGTLEALNRAWYRRFESWDEVEPNRLSTILSYTDYIDWRTFITEKLSDDLRARYDAVKRVLPNAVATSHAAAPDLFTTPLAGDGNPDDWQAARVVDFWGTSFYPKHSFPVGRDPAWRGALLDFTRSSTHGAFWIGELQGGFGTVALRVSATVTAADLRMWMWSALARGAKAINLYAWYPMSSGYESGGFGLINLDGTLTERARVAAAVAKAVEANRELFLHAHPPAAEVAIVYNPLSYMVGGRRPQSEMSAIERNSMLGFYRALFPTNVPIDFVHINEIGKQQYKLIILPYPLMISEMAARRLREFVRNGGSLVAEARLAWNDERGRAQEIIPGFGLHEVCGCRETSVQMTASGKVDLGEFKGALYQETLEPSSGHVIAHFADGARAIVTNDFGKGHMMTIGTFIGTAYEADRDETLAKFIRSLLDWAGVQRPLEAPPGVEVRMLESGTDRIIFAFNHNDSSADVVLSGIDLETGARVSRKTLPPQGVWVLRVGRAAGSAAATPAARRRGRGRPRSGRPAAGAPVDITARSFPTISSGDPPTRDSSSCARPRPASR
jgi:beta-galactosidase